MTCKATSQGPASIAWTPELPDVYEDNSEPAWLAFDYWRSYHAGELALIASSSVSSDTSVRSNLIGV